MTSKADEIPTSKRKRYEELRKILEQERDDLRVRMHLARSEVVDEWEELEEKWHHFGNKTRAVKKKLKTAGTTAGESGEQISESWHLLLDEIKTGYDRIRKNLR